MAGGSYLKVGTVSLRVQAHIGGLQVHRPPSSALTLYSNAHNRWPWYVRQTLVCACCRTRLDLTFLKSQRDAL